MIGFRTDGDLKASGWIHLILLVPKKRFVTLFTTNLQPDLHLLAIHVWHTQYCRHLWLWHWHPITSGNICIIIHWQWDRLIWKWTYSDWWSVDCLIGFWTEKPGYGDAFRWTRIDGWEKWQLPHPLNTWSIYQRRSGDYYWRTQIDGDGDGPCIFQISYINIHLLIDRSIGRSIYQQTEKRIEEHISRTTEIRTHYLNDISTERRKPPSTEKSRGVTGTGCVYFKSDTSIFTYLSIDRSIDLSTDRKNRRRETSVVQQISVCITWLIYQQRCRDPYQRTKINGRAVYISNPRHQYSPINQSIYQWINWSIYQQTNEMNGGTHQ